jgi:glycosyltransferase involved in cell wall biosynthesis
LGGRMMPDARDDRPDNMVPPEAGAPQFSIVIPIHNEAECLAAEVAELVGEMDTRGVGYELILAENGSTDDTPAIAARLAETNPRIRALRVPVPDYGFAMKTGMLAGRGDLVVNFDIDFHNVDFMLRAGAVLTGAGAVLAGAGADTGFGRSATTAADASAGIVVGSKLIEGADDRRSPARHLISLGFTTILRVLFDRHMDDTHGMKVLRRDVVERYAPQTIMTTDLFDTELIIRARRGGVIVKALPVTVEEKRKARSSIVRRIPRTMKNLIKLRIVLWKEGSAGS